MENMFKDLLTHIYISVLKPLGWKKDGSNFRFYCDDGLCKIINFQKSRWNTKERCTFYINIGLYIEAGDKIENKKFHEYNCQLRNRTSSERGEYELNCCTNVSEAREKYVKIINNEVLPFFDNFNSKAHFVELLLSGKAQQYTGIPVMHYYTCKLLSDMGYDKEVLDIIKGKKGLFENLAKEIEKRLLIE